MALTKQIKTMRCAIPELVVEHDVAKAYFNTPWAIDDKIRLIGISMFLDLGKGTLAGGAENSGIDCDLACYRQSGENNKRLLKMVRRLFVDDITIGVGSHLAMFGQPFGELVMMFPEGYGIDLEDGDYLYASMSLEAIGWASGTACCSGAVNFYYVER